MKKTLTLIAAGLLTAAAATAQTTGPRLHPNPHYNTALLKAAAYGGATAAAKTNGTAQRLSAAANYYEFGSGLERNDSLTYVYSQGRGSAYNFETMYYNVMHRADNSGGYVNCDSVHHYDGAGTALLFTEVNLRDAAGRITAQTPIGSFMYFQTAYQYDAQGRMTEMIMQIFSTASNAWVNNYRSAYAYNSQGKIIGDTTQQWNGNAWETRSVYAFTYTPAGAPSVTKVYRTNAGNLEDDFRIFHEYDAAGKPLTREYERWTGIGYEPADYDSLHYSGDKLVFWRSSTYDGSTWIKTAEQHRRLNAASLPDSIHYWAFNIPLNQIETSYEIISYNSANNPVINTLHDNLGIARMVRYYYEDYQTTNVKNTAARKALAVYPNPAGSVLYLRPIESGAVTYNIVNTAGQTLLKGASSTVAGQAIALPVERLAPGQYWLQLEDKSGTQYGATFLKQ